MAQPQGLNVPAIATTAVVTVLLTGVIVEGVRALYAYEEPRVEERRWNELHGSTVNSLRDEQEKNIKFNTSVPIDQAMAKVVETGGKMPSTKPTDSIASMIAESRRLSAEGRYEESLKVVDQILSVDSKNEYAVNVRLILVDKAALAHQQKVSEEFDRKLRENAK